MTPYVADPTGIEAETADYVPTPERIRRLTDLIKSGDLVVKGKQYPKKRRNGSGGRTRGGNEAKAKG